MVNLLNKFSLDMKTKDSLVCRYVLQQQSVHKYVRRSFNKQLMQPAQLPNIQRKAVKNLYKNTVMKNRAIKRTNEKRHQKEEKKGQRAKAASKTSETEEPQCRARRAGEN